MDMLSVAAGKLASGEMYKTRFEEIEKTAGWNYNADGLGQDRALRPLVDIMQSGTWDWVHTLFQDGVLTTEVELLIEHCGSIGVTRIALQTFLRDLAWQFPLAQSGKAKQLHRIFDHHRQSATAATRVKASCAELLGVYGLVRHFVEHRLAPATDDDTKKCLESFKALCQAVDIILLAKRGLASVDVASDSLAVALARFSRLHRAAYGDDNIRPKHHWLLDIPPQLKRDHPNDSLGRRGAGDIHAGGVQFKDVKVADRDQSGAGVERRPRRPRWRRGLRRWWRRRRQ